MPSINIAVTGCGHGELDNYYRMCEVFKQKGKPIDLLVITGDFQAVRNQEDLGCMKSPDKYLRRVHSRMWVHCRWISSSTITEK